MKRSRGGLLGHIHQLTGLVALPLLLGSAIGNGCSAGGDVPPAPDASPALDASPVVDAEPAPSCGPADCARLPVPQDAKTCPGGTTVNRSVCAKGPSGTCFWDFPACPAATDASACGCAPDMQWGPNGGLVSSSDMSTLSSCTSYQHVRTYRATTQPNLSCQQDLLACGSGLHSGRDIVTALSQPDVQSALSASPVVYGVDDRPEDGQVLRIQIGTSIIDVGYDCTGQTGCVPIPSGVASLAALLRAIDTQELGLPPCSGVFPQP